jgi:hypothetical protein
MSTDVLSVREAVAVVKAAGMPIGSERSFRRLLAAGTWRMTRTAAGYYGVTLTDLQEYYPPLRAGLTYEAELRQAAAIRAAGSGRPEEGKP